MDIIDAIIQQESGGNPRSLNRRTGAMGLMQVMPDTARSPGFGVKPLADPWNPTENRRFGSEYFNAMSKRYSGDRDAALAAYNWGPGNADKWVASGKAAPLPAETRNYIDSINAMMGSSAPAPQSKRPTMATPQRPLSSAMSSSSLVPGIMGGGDEPGYFGKLFADPTFLMGASVLGAGLSGRDAGSALTQGAQAAAATTELAERRRRASQWQKLMSGQGNNAALEGVPPDVLEIMRSAGPEEGMKMMGQLAMERVKRSAPREMAPGSTLYDPTKGQAIFTAPTESPYAKELAHSQAKADVKSAQSAKAGQQILDLTDQMAALAGAPGSPERKTFEDTIGPLQGTSWYQGAKGFINSKAETPIMYGKIQQDLGTIKLLATRAYLSGEGQVTENERHMVADAVGRVESAPSADAALEAMNNLKQIVNQVFLKPHAPGVTPTGQPAGGAAPPPPAAALPAGAPSGVPGLTVEGGPPPAAAPAAAPAGGAAPVTATGPNGEKVQLDPTSNQWVPAQAPAAEAAPPAAAAAAPADRGPFTGVRPKGPNILDRWVLRSEAERNPKIIEQFNAAFGAGAAEKLLSEASATAAQGHGRYNYRATR